MSIDTALTMGAPDCGSLRWFVVQTQGGHEARAEEGLLEQAYEVFLPLTPVVVRHARKTETVVRPLFPAYLFVAALDVREWRPIENTRGCLHVIRNGDYPAAMPRGEIEALLGKCIVEGEGAKRRYVLTPKPLVYEAGQKLLLNSGPMVDRLATCQGMDAKGRVRLLLQLLGRPVELTVPVGWVGQAG